MDPLTLGKQPNPDDEDQVGRLENIRPVFVSLVDYGANWGGQRHFFVLKRAELAKAVPGKDASTEDKEAARAARSTKYGIQVLETGSALTYPANGPTTESLYGDPVNLKYPLGYEANERDAARVRNALARFKQNAAAYTEESSRGRVYERIVRAALAEGIDVSFDPEDPVDALLPGDLKDRLAKGAEGGPEPPAAAAAEASSLALCAQVLDVEARILAITKVQHPVTPPADSPAPSPAPPAGGSDLQVRVEQLEKDNAVAQAELAKARRELTEERAKRARLAKDTGRLSGLQSGPTAPAPAVPMYPLDYNAQ